MMGPVGKQVRPNREISQLVGLPSDVHDDGHMALAHEVSMLRQTFGGSDMRTLQRGYYDLIF